MSRSHYARIHTYTQCEWSLRQQLGPYVRVSGNYKSCLVCVDGIVYQQQWLIGCHNYFSSHLISSHCISLSVSSAGFSDRQLITTSSSLHHCVTLYLLIYLVYRQQHRKDNTDRRTTDNLSYVVTLQRCLTVISAQQHQLNEHLYSPMAEITIQYSMNIKV